MSHSLINFTNILRFHHLIPWCLVTIGVFSAEGALAQTPVPAEAKNALEPVPVAPALGPRKVTIFLTAKGQQLPSAEGADHRAEITMRDSVSGMLREFYPSGKSWRIIPFAHVERGLKHGVETSFAESGKMLTRQEFVAGQAEGDLVAYYPTGEVKSRTHFLHDQRQGKKCFTAAGADRICPADDAAPTYPGGESALINDIVTKVKHTRQTLHKTVKGHDVVLHLAVVRVRLAVDSLGMVTHTDVLYAPMDSWSAAVLKVLPKLQRFTPAQRDGVVVADAVEVALTFALEDEQPSAPAESLYQPNLGQARGTREIRVNPRYQQGSATQR